MKRPPADFRSNFEAAQPPILIDNGVAVLENEKIERVYSKFKHMLLKRDDTSKNAMTTILTKVNDMLAEKGSRFLTGETLCCFDCELMPKLQHVRVAGSFFC